MIALVTQLSGMGVLSAMAGNAGCTQFLGSNICRMAGVATELVMCSWQCKSAIARMIEFRWLPAIVIMAGITLLSHSPCMGILSLMTAIAILRNGIQHKTSRMTTHTICASMYTQ